MSSIIDQILSSKPKTDGSTAQGTLRGNEMFANRHEPLKQRFDRSSTTVQDVKDAGTATKEWFSGLKKLDQAAIATMPIPVLGDLIGLLADADAFKDDPSVMNAVWSMAGVLPFVPPMVARKAAAKALNKGEQGVTDIADARKTDEVVDQGADAADADFEEMMRTTPLNDNLDTMSFKTSIRDLEKRLGRESSQGEYFELNQRLFDMGEHRTIGQEMDLVSDMVEEAGKKVAPIDPSVNEGFKRLTGESAGVTDLDTRRIRNEVADAGGIDPSSLDNTDAFFDAANTLDNTFGETIEEITWADLEDVMLDQSKAGVPQADIAENARNIMREDPSRLTLEMKNQGRSPEDIESIFKDLGITADILDFP